MTNKKKILIVDDDVVLRKLYKDLLSMEDYEVEEAIDGKQGLAMLSEGGYDLTLLDIVLPYMDGIGILQELHNHPPKTPNGPILVLTNLDTDSTLLDSEDDGAAEYLVKSEITPGEMVEKIKKYLE